MKFYVYAGDAELGNEPLGTACRYVWRDLKTIKGAIKRARKYFPGIKFTLYSFTEFYDDSTFRRILHGAVYSEDANLHHS